MWLPFRRGKERPGTVDPALAGAPPGEARYVVIDSELTGLDERRDSILSLGAVQMHGGRIDLQRNFYEEVRPATALTAQSIVVHGITPDQVEEKPAIGEVLADFVRFCGGRILVGHFVAIDLAFLRKELLKVPGLSLPGPAVDTWALYESLSSSFPADGGPQLPRLKDPRLYEVAGALGVECRRAHDAFADAFVTAQVFQRLLRQAGRWGIRTTADLLRAGSPERIHGFRGGPDLPLT